MVRKAPPCVLLGIPVPPGHFSKKNNPAVSETAVFPEKFGHNDPQLRNLFENSGIP
jgi:hypothetical protein